jgi:hypothetical protein
LAYGSYSCFGVYIFTCIDRFNIYSGDSLKEYRDWIGRKQEDWIGKKIVSQYGLVCEVIDSKEVNGKVIITCRSIYNSKVWEWGTDTISLVTKSGEILDATGEIFGKITNDDWDLYSDEQCRKVSQEVIDAEFTSK